MGVISISALPLALSRVNACMRSSFMLPRRTPSQHLHRAHTLQDGERWRRQWSSRHAVEAVLAAAAAAAAAEAAATAAAAAAAAASAMATWMATAQQATPPPHQPSSAQPSRQMACARIQSGLAYDGDAPHSNTNSVIACNCLCCGLPALPGPSDCSEWSSKHPVLPWLLDLRPWYSALLGWWGVPQASFGQFATQSHKNLHPLVQGLIRVASHFYS
jgi:hypothetical protein